MNSLDLHLAVADGDPCSSEEGVHIPGCWACVIRDHDSCTCGKDGGPNRAGGTGARFLAAQDRRTYGDRDGIEAPGSPRQDTPGGWQDTPAPFTVVK